MYVICIIYMIQYRNSAENYLVTGGRSFRLENGYNCFKMENGYNSFIPENIYTHFKTENG